MDSLPFIPGLELSALLYREAVCPILATHLPQRTYSAARLDAGSEVLGFDTPRSRDHDWGPRLTVFLAEEDAHLAPEIMTLLAEQLPLEVHGYPTHFGGKEGGVRWMEAVPHGPVRHLVRVTTLARFCHAYLGFPAHLGLGVTDWLTLEPQKLRAIGSGAVYHDGLGTLQRLRETLRWYPHDLWLYLLACQWRRIDQEEPFMARCGDVGDDLGSRIVAARLVLDLMRLAFLMERSYPPYIKWLGTAFARLSCADELGPLLERVLAAATWQKRQEHLSEAYRVVGRMHNALGLTPFVEPRIAPFFDRPYLVPGAGRFEEALYAAIADPAVRTLPRYVGAVWQYTDSTDVLSYPDCSRSLGAFYV
ncbi:MAG: DUF4037 domain-containing protein [Anaerolineae bacterium]